MKKTIIQIIAACMALFLTSCADFLDLSPRNKISEDVVYGSEAAIDALVANIYGRLPIEEFNWSPYAQSNFSIYSNRWNSHMSPCWCDEAMQSQFDDKKPEEFDLWEWGYELLRDINMFIAKNDQCNVSDERKARYLGEGHMLRAQVYGELAKRYGGVPLISKPQDYNGNLDSLKVPRSTELETWKYVLSECDLAAELLDEGTDTRRFNRWSALAYKSRYALYAGSVAKFAHENNVYSAGEAVDKKLIGMDASDADFFFGEVIDAAGKIMDSGKFGLYHPNPTSQDDARTHYIALFEDPDACISSPQEPIFCVGYKVLYRANNHDVFNRPNQTSGGWKYPGRTNPALDLVDAYDDYNDDGVDNAGKKILTTVGGAGDDDYVGYNPQKNYLKFDSPLDIFAGKDIRLAASIILPGSTYKGTTIVIQGGIVKPDGSFVFRSDVGADGITGPDGKAYYTYGSADKMGYSGFDPGGSGSYTRSGFLVRKWMQEKRDITADTGNGDNTWIDMRYGEVLLNYAEAVAEHSAATGEQRIRAQEAINAIRHRAAHTDELKITGDVASDRAIVRNERRIELALESKRYWDLFRWRTFHLEFDNRNMASLVPFIDLREDQPKYLFVRMYMPEFVGKTFMYSSYYRKIPGTANSGLVQNP